MNTERRWVIFDLGKVLLDFDFAIAAKELARYSPQEEEQILESINQSPLLHTFERGDWSEAQFFQKLSVECRLEASLEELKKGFAEIFTPVPSMVEFMESLKERGIPVMVFSNTNVTAVDYIRAAFPFFERFDAYCLSYEHGCMKPDTTLYGVAQLMTRCTPGNLLFLDDRAENVHAARQMGWNAIHHQAPEDSIEGVNQWLGA
ncbi:MAG TPA: hypothetical protein DEP78_03545 [Verrucomicrobiales bacterium]|nr:hypothetical protein [Verrucomicrobiales bacterium]